MKKMKKTLLVLASVAAVAILCLAVVFWRDSNRGKLPWSASNEQVYSKSYGTQGWTYCLRAQLPKRDFQKFASRLGVRPLTTEYHPYIHWEDGCPTNWWDPSPVTADTYGRDNGMGLDILKYENGHVYFKSTGS